MHEQEPTQPRTERSEVRLLPPSKLHRRQTIVRTTAAMVLGGITLGILADVTKHEKAIDPVQVSGGSIARVTFREWGWDYWEGLGMNPKLLLEERYCAPTGARTRQAVLPGRGGKSISLKIVDYPYAFEARRLSFDKLNYMSLDALLIREIERRDREGTGFEFSLGIEGEIKPAELLPESFNNLSRTWLTALPEIACE